MSHCFNFRPLTFVVCVSQYMGNSGCYMYFHVLSKDVLSVRPPDYEEPAPTDTGASVDAEEKDPANGFDKVCSPCLYYIS